MSQQKTGQNIPVEIERVEFGTAGSGNEQLCITVVDEDGARYWWYGFFSDRALPTTTKALREIGWDPEQHNWDLTQIHGTDLLVGNPAAITTESESDQSGNPRIRVRWLNGPNSGGGMKNAMSSQDVANFSRRLQALTRGGGAPAPQQRAPETGFSRASTTQDDNIPF